MDWIVSIQLKEEDKQPLYIQLYSYLEKLIKAGTLEGGVRLPPVRKLAQALDVNPVTVVSAYKMLEQNGLVYSKVGSGTYVSDSIVPVSAGGLESPLTDEIFDEEIHLMSRGQITLRENSINLASATPTPDLFPVEDFKKMLNHVLDRDKGEAFGYHESGGYRELRDSIAVFLQANYKIRTDAEHIQIISGAQQGIDVIAKALINPGDYVIVENPTYTGAVAVFKSRGAKIIGVPMESDGIDLDILEKSVLKYQPKLVYTMPNYQNPTTYCYSQKKKEYLLKLAAKHHFFIIEDDFLSDLNYAASTSPSMLKAMESEEKVIYIKSFSKVLMPGLRIGFLITPKEIFADILQAKHTTDISSSGLIQRAFDLYLRNGIWGSHLAYMKGIYQKRYDKILQEAEALKHLGIRFKEPKGGLNLWLNLPESLSGTKLYLECIQKEVLVTPGKIFYLPDTVNNKDANVRISFAAAYGEHIEKGLEILYDCAKKLQGSPKTVKSYYSPLL